MKRNFEVPVLDFDGRPHVRAMFKFDEKGMPVMKNGLQEFDRHVPMTLRTYALEALGGRWQKDVELGVDGNARMKLYNKILMSLDGTVDLEANEPGLILQALEHQGRAFVVVDAMSKMLAADPKVEPATAEASQA
jgi:hypothetical protein